MIKFCSDCGATGSVWRYHNGVEHCRCGSPDLRPLDDRIIELEFQSIIETAFSPLERYTIECEAIQSMEE